MDQYIGKMLDNRYEVLERIGTGGMAVVYKARCHRLNRLVAIKILKPELASDEDFLRRFHAESQAVAMLSHINIVSIYDVCHSDGLNYIVMELIDGMTLKQYMKKRGTPLNWREALHFITQIVRALGHAHSRGIVHRDIKPHNIMVLRDGSVKVADFGIARLTSAAQSTLTQEALGSVHYISPEQAKGSTVDGRSDLYSAGVVLYEMLTGRLPFEGEAPVFVAIQHINSIPIAPRELNPDIPEALEAITMKAMAPNPEQRYASAEEMLADLKEFRKNPGAPLPKPAPRTEDADEVEEPTMVMPVDALNTLEKKPGAAAERKVERSARHKPEPAREERTRRGGIPPALLAVVAILVVLGAAVFFVYNFLLKDLMAPPVEYQIPDLRGYTVEEVNNSLILGKFRVEYGPKVYSDNYEEGQICAQDPAPKTMVRDENTIITVTISSGSNNIYMIDVENWDSRKALRTLQNEMGLVVNQKEEYSSEYAKGYVISYSPIDGTLLHKGDSVTIVISKGPQPVSVTVPNFVDMPLEQAKSQLESLGLTLGKVDAFYSDDYPEGDIIWQSLPATYEAEQGDLIDFQVSKGPEPKPSQEPEPSPSPSDEIVVPSEGVDAPVTTRSIQVDLSSYEGTVHLRIVVGNATLIDSRVDSTANPLIIRETTGTGTQQVNIYIDDVLVDSYPLEF